MRVKAKPLGWDATDDGAPSLAGLPEYVEGELTTKHIHSEFAGVTVDYTKYMVGDVDVDHRTVIPLAPKSVSRYGFAPGTPVAPVTHLRGEPLK